MAGPLSGIRIIEFAGIGPGPYCAMMLADHGANLVRVDRPGSFIDSRDPLVRNRKSIILDMKQPGGIEVVRDLCKSADGIIEGYRPGVMERLGLGPTVLLADNPRLVYGRMTGWGQYGPYAQSAGHDINYIALSGVLHGIGSLGQKPVPPVNYVGDFGGGGMMLAFGMVSGLLHAAKSGEGQIIDCAMTDGSALLASMTWGFWGMGHWQDRPGVNLLDGGAPFYDTYRCLDDKYISIGSIEPQFYALLREKAGLTADPDFDAQMDRTRWSQLKARLADIFAAKTRSAWCEIMEMTDICFAPVLSLDEAPSHPHNVARQTFIKVAGINQPAPAPRYSVTVNDSPRAAPAAGADSQTILEQLGYDSERIAALISTGSNTRRAKGQTR